MGTCSCTCTMHAVLTGDRFSLLSGDRQSEICKSLLTSKGLKFYKIQCTFIYTVVHNLCMCLVVLRGSDKYLDTLTAPAINMQTLMFKT